ncbi:MAG: hypothetical protein NTU63_00225 [Candidatus Pacearchaeota archaeon]|nr:hypothetical protein [Candidatus Pacearchaeota archaeon]
MRDKKGWIRIVEAFVSILLITGVVLVVLNKGYIVKEDISERVYQAELSILRGIQTNDELRVEIIQAGEPLPIEWEEFEAKVPNLKAEIISRTPNYLSCIGKICKMNEICTLEENKNQDVFVQSVTIAATLEEVKYRQLKLFCWEK